MTAIVSFTEFLRTGRLGPLHTGMTPGEVARLLGVPSAWIVGDDDHYPHYWCYGRLEIAFHAPQQASDRPSMRFFQLEHADSLTGDGEAFPGAAKTELVMTLDGLDGRARPSDILRAMQDGTDTHVRFEYFKNDDQVTVSVVNGQVTAIWTATFPDAGPKGVANIETCARAAETNARFDSIYAFAPMSLTRPVPDPGSQASGEAAIAAQPMSAVAVSDARKISLVCASQAYLGLISTGF